MRSWAVPRSAQEVPPRNTLTSEDYWQTDYPNPRLSTITERTENLASRPTSFAQTNLSTRDLDNEVPALQPQASSHFRASTDVPQATRSPLFGPRSPAGRHVGQKVAYWEHRLGATSPSAHSRSASEPSGFSTQSTLTTFSGTAPSYTASYDPSTTRSISPMQTSTFISNSVSDTYTPSQSYVDTITGTDTLTHTYTTTDPTTISQASTHSSSTFRRPQGSPRSPLSAVRNIMQRWREQTPVNVKSPKSPSISPTSTGNVGVRQSRRGPDTTPRPRLSGHSEGNNNESHSQSGRSDISSPNGSITSSVHVRMVSEYIGATTEVSLLDAFLSSQLLMILISLYVPGFSGILTFTHRLPTNGNGAMRCYTLECLSSHG